MSAESLYDSVLDTQRVAYYHYHEYQQRKEMEKNAHLYQKLEQENQEKDEFDKEFGQSEMQDGR